MLNVTWLEGAEGEGVLAYYGDEDVAVGGTVETSARTPPWKLGRQVRAVRLAAAADCRVRIGRGAHAASDPAGDAGMLLKAGDVVTLALSEKDRVKVIADGAAALGG